MSRLAAGVLLGGLRGTDPEQWLLDLVDEGLAGVVLFAENTPDVPTTRRLTDQLHARNPRLLVMSDEEGGDVTRIEHRTGSSLPGSAALGVVDDEELTHSCAESYARLLALAGIDVALSPVLDVASEPLNPVIGVRSFGADPDLVTRHGRAWCEGLRRGGVRSVAKHFPGHGDTTVDSHLALPCVEAPAGLLHARDLVPFGRAGADAVMSAHVLYPALGEGPASVSRWATDLARQLGIAGPIVTDALGMRALSDRWGMGEACVRALKAGADLLCLDAPQNRDPRAALDEAMAAIDEALAAGRLDAAVLTASARRTDTLASTAPRPELAALDPVRRELAWLGGQAARAAITTRGAVVRPEVTQFVDLRRSQNHAAGSTGGAFAAEAAAHWPSARLVHDPDQVRPGEATVVLVREPRVDPTEGELLGRVLARVPDAVVVHAGMPASAPAAECLVLSCGVGRANARAALDAVAGVA